MASMTSQNHWPVFTNQTRLRVLPWVTGRILDGDSYVILDYLLKRFNDEVESIRRADSWGYAYRPIRGKLSGFSNHSSGTAVDVNATTHPLGARYTFRADQVTALRRILKELEGVVRWGGDYSGRKDEMHFEINVSPGSPSLARIARKVSGPGLPVAPPKPSAGNPAAKPTLRPFSLANVVNSRARGWQHANIAIIQAALNKHYLVHKQGRLAVDGWWGDSTQRVFDAYRLRVMKLTRVEDYTGAPGLKSVQHLLAGSFKVS